MSETSRRTPRMEGRHARSARRRAREYAVQALYQWQLAGTALDDLEQAFTADSDFAEADRDYFEHLLRGATADASALEQQLAGALDRPVGELSPVERSILLLAVYEFVHGPEIPYRVVINEAIELAKTFGGTDGHKYVNGVLDKLAPQLRPYEKAPVSKVGGKSTAQ